MGRFRTVSSTRTHRFGAQHRFEHWYRDNTVYFITSRVRNKLHLFKREDAQNVFWDRFAHWSAEYAFAPWCVTLMSNHYHVVGYLSKGDRLGPMMQRFHGSVAKLVNDTLKVRHLPFWKTQGNQDYFDGCLRDERQVRKSIRYTLTQASRAGLVKHWSQYTNTKLYVDVDDAVKWALKVHAIPIDLPYARYERRAQPTPKPSKRTGRFSDQ